MSSSTRFSRFRDDIGATNPLRLSSISLSLIKVLVIKVRVLIWPESTPEISCAISLRTVWSEEASRSNASELFNNFPL